MRNSKAGVYFALVALCCVATAFAAFETFDTQNEGKTGLKDTVSKLNTNFTKIGAGTENIAGNIVTVAKTLTVTGAQTNASTIKVVGLATLNDLTVVTNAAVGGTLAVTGATSLNGGVFVGARAGFTGVVTNKMTDYTNLVWIGSGIITNVTLVGTMP